jgi:hypothetical protein
MPNPALEDLAKAIAVPNGEAGTIYMRQHWSMLEAVTGGVFERSNIYDIYNTNVYEDPNKIIQVQARSTNCERHCCAPYHSIMLHVNDLHGNTIVTIQRPGFGSGKYCLQGCCAMTPCCAPAALDPLTSPLLCRLTQELTYRPPSAGRDGVIVHQGKVEAEPACLNMGNKCCDGCGHGDLTNPNPISKAEVPFCGGGPGIGGCYPNVDVFEEVDSPAPNGKLMGPCFFGGVIELCCESEFTYSTIEGNRRIGRIQKLVPRSVGQACERKPFELSPKRTPEHTPEHSL